MRFNPLLDRLKTYPQTALDQKKREVRAAGRPLYDFGTGDPVEPTPPFIAAAIRDAVPEVSQYPEVLGPPALRRSIAGYLERRFGVAMDPETQILPSSGSKEAIFHLPLAFIDPAAEDRVVVYPDPGYPVYERGTLFAGGIPYAQRLHDDFVQRPWELPAEVVARTRILWINSPHNPSGAVAHLDDLRRTWEFCREHDILLVNDECYADVYDHAAPPSLLQVGTEGVVVIHSLSKRSGMTGYRSGFMAGDREAMGLIRRFRVNPGCVPQDIVNAGAAAAWADDAHAEERRGILRAKKDYFAQLLGELRLEIVASEATLYTWFKPPAGVDEHAYALRLVEAGIVVSPGTFFGSVPGYLRAAMVPPVEVIREAAGAWKQVHREMGWS